MLAELLGALIEIVGEFVLELIFELAAEALSGLINGWKQSSLATSAIGLVFGGAAAGFLSIWVFPSRLIARAYFFLELAFCWRPLQPDL